MAPQPESELKIVFGTMTLGAEGQEQARIYSVEGAAAILDVFQKFGHNEIDTARTYSKGTSEELIGNLNWQDRGIVVATKLSPKADNAFVKPAYSHKPETLRAALLESLAALKTDKVDLWYLHAPDHDTPYEDTLREVNNLYNEGYFKRFGISNYAAWEVAQISEITIRNGWKRPDVYQGIYNAFHRSVEAELFPALRYYNIAFYQFNPLAGGFLTDRYQRETEVPETGGRFDPKKAQGANYRARYWNDAYFDALDVVRGIAKKHGISTAEAALRWVSHHSFLKKEKNDAVIIGASSTGQLEENLTNLTKGPLPEELVLAFDEGWRIVKAIAKPYNR
ncbi:NADP-dependent oxidoreductase domain-containing protein [Bisporella sp. PMI_857]|nr:NADP-dependent oxidoreductase domain-containing protein [Bisporella sp. PMI_857]